MLNPFEEGEIQEYSELGGFGENPSDGVSSLDLTYYGITALKILESEPEDVQKAMDYVGQFKGDGYFKDAKGNPSIENTFFGIAIYSALGIELEQREGFLDWIFKNCFFNDFSGVTDSPRGCIGSLNRLEGLPEVDKRLKRILLKRIVEGRINRSIKGELEGEIFQGQVEDSKDPRVFFLEEAIDILLGLGAGLGDNFKAESIDFIKSCQNEDGGFGDFPGDSSGFMPSYSAVKALVRLEADFNKDGAVEWLYKQEKDRFKTGLYFNILWESWMVLKTLNLLGEKPQNSSEVVDWLKKCQNV